MEQDDLEIIKEIAIPETISEFDTQVSTAKRFPRIVTRCIENATAIVSMDEQTAKTCGYMIPRGGKQITGPSVHLARIMAQTWGNMRVSQSVVGEEEKYVICEAVAWDLETNMAVKTTLKRKILDSKGKRYNDDMIQVTGNAAMAIAFRNAVFAVIPKGAWQNVYDASLRKITGNINTEDKIIAKRKELLQSIEKLGATEKQVLAFFGFRTITQIRVEEIVKLIQLEQAIKDGEVTIDSIFPVDDTVSKNKLADIINKKTQQPEGDKVPETEKKVEPAITDDQNKNPQEPSLPLR